MRVVSRCNTVELRAPWQCYRRTLLVCWHSDGAIWLIFLRRHRRAYFCLRTEENTCLTGGFLGPNASQFCALNFLVDSGLCSSMSKEYSCLIVRSLLHSWSKQIHNKLGVASLRWKQKSPQIVNWPLNVHHSTLIGSYIVRGRNDKARINSHLAKN